ncbi:MAG TPA: efflux RND transporter permease subunit, partial [Holophagaceae bacterium]|nr:efflux RND transporter permease subunit [Holophagaceae bacterium]
FQNLYDVSQAVLDKARKSGMFYFVDSDLKIDKPQDTVTVDRDMTAQLGLTQQDVGGSLSAALGGGYVNYFSIGGRSYRVIPQVLQKDRLNPDQVLDYYVRTPSGQVVPASTVATLERKVVPESISHFQQLNSATISGVPSGSQADTIAFMQKTLQEVAPSGYTADFSGVSRQYVQESGGFLLTMFFAIIIVFLALAAQFNSFRDPVIILISVPLALFGAMSFIFALPWVGQFLPKLAVTKVSLNIYTQVGLVTLMGLISKHGILIVEFANELQRSGQTKFDAIVEAAAIRLRPILMTTAAMVLGVFPLVIASGAGAAGRINMGVVIFTGLSIGTLFTLFVVPAFYLVLGTDHHAEQRHEVEVQG